MKIFAEARYALVLLLFAGSVNSAFADFSQPVPFTLPYTLHFLSISGDDVVLAAGSYRIEYAESWLKLVPDGEGPESAVLVEAIFGKHERQLADATVQLHQDSDNSDVYHLVLLLSDGSGFESVGTVSGIRPRGLRMVFLN
ncbi:MAG: hypothetical protein AB7P17_15660, partial [Nitrospirales bacterium]